MARQPVDSLLDTIPCGYVWVDDDSRVLLANKTFHDLMKAEPGSLITQDINKLFSPGVSIFYQTHVFPLLKMTGKLDELYLSLRTSQGDDLPVLLNGRRRTIDGELINELIIVPMRRRNQFEEELLQARRSAQAASQARERFLYMLSHDLRTPLTAISMSAELLLTGLSGPLTELQQADIERVKEASDYVMSMIADILAYSRLESGQVELRIEPVIVAEVVSRAQTMVGHLLAAGDLQLSTGACAANIVALADRERLQQVLLNLLSNAMKFTDAGGQIRVACRAEGEYVHLSVSDSGQGIPAEKLSKVFEAFTQVDNIDSQKRALGVGLGLSISQQLIRAMDGDIRVESELGQGSTFTITLPAAELS